MAEPQHRDVPGPGDRAKSLLWQVVTGVTLFVAALAAFRGMLRERPFEVFPDHLFHILPALGKEGWNGPQRITYPLYHKTLTLVLGLFPEKGWPSARWSAAIVLALAVALRGWFSFAELRGPLPAAGAAVVCLLLAVAMALPSGFRSPVAVGRPTNVWWPGFPSVYEGALNPNVWHNPTTIFAAPFAVLLFRLAILYLEAPGAGKALAVGISSAVCSLAKPNYLLAFLPCFGLVMLGQAITWLRQGRRDARLAPVHALLAFALPIATLAWQFQTTFGGESKVVFQPMAVWSASIDPAPAGQPHRIRPLVLAERVPRGILAGLAFPLVAIACFARPARTDLRIVLAWSVLATAVAEYALLAQSGIEFLSGNFFWALVPASYILYLESCRLAGAQPRGPRVAICFGVLAVHAASGAICLARTLTDPLHSLLF